MNYESGLMRFDQEGNPVSSLSGSMLWLRPATVAVPQWQENYEACVEYRERFGVAISLPFWFANSMTRAREFVEEALEKNKRRWILECGPWGCNPPISEFADVIITSGRAFNSLSLEDTACLWLDPVEWREIKNPE
jgi:hypothetical protein